MISIQLRRCAALPRLASAALTLVLSTPVLSTLTVSALTISALTISAVTIGALTVSRAVQAAPPTFSEPKAFGQLHEIMMMGKSDPNVRLDQLPRKNAYAIGALSGLRGEVTILDGTIWLSYGSPDGAIKVESKPSSEETATLLVYSQVTKWQSIQLTEDTPFQQLDATIERLAREKGADVTKPFPLRIEGQLQHLRWHSLMGVAPQPGGHHHADHDQAVISKTNAKARGQLIGFFSTAHQGIFTHMGENTHLHVVLPHEKQMGHVDSITVKAGASLFMPR